MSLDDQLNLFGLLEIDMSLLVLDCVLLLQLTPTGYQYLEVLLGVVHLNRSLAVALQSRAQRRTWAEVGAVHCCWLRVRPVEVAVAARNPSEEGETLANLQVA